MSGSAILAHEARTPAPWEEKIELVKGLLGSKDLPNDQFEVFLYQCRRTGLDPLARQIYGLPFKSKNAAGVWETRLTIVTGIDGYRLIADRSGLYAGSDDATYGEPHKVKISLTGRDGAVYKTVDIGAPKSATVTVYKVVGGIRCPFTGTARWDEYFPSRKPGKWEDMPYLMLAKCAEALALRKAFPADIYGLYIAEELDRAVSLEPSLGSGIDPATGQILESDAPAAKTAPPSTNGAAAAIAAAAKPRTAATLAAQAPVADDPAELEKARKRYWAMHGELGFPAHSEDVNKRLNHELWGLVLRHPVTSMTEMTLADFKALNEWARAVHEGTAKRPAFEERRLKMLAEQQPALEEAVSGKPLAEMAAKTFGPATFEQVVMLMDCWTAAEVAGFRSACAGNDRDPDEWGLHVYSLGAKEPAQFLIAARDPFVENLAEVVV